MMASSAPRVKRFSFSNVSRPTVERPIQDARELGMQLRLQLVILFPSHVRESSSSTMRPTMAVEASPSRGSSLEITCSRRAGCRPLLLVLAVHRERVLAADVSSRSTTMLPFLPTKRASEMTPGLPISGASKVAAQAVERRPATFSCRPARRDASHRALAAACRADHEQDLVQIEPARNDITEPLAEHVDGFGLLRPQFVEEGKPLCRLWCARHSRRER